MGNQYRDTGWFGIALTLLVVAFVLLNVVRANRGAKLFIRRIAGLNAIDEAVGRATELGKPVLMVPGLSSIDAISMQAINIFAHVTRIAAQFSNPILMCCSDAAVLTVAQETIRDVYQREGVPEKYDPDAIRFVSDRQFAYAAGIAGLMLREQTAACFFMGKFFAESLILAETANSIGAIQIASSSEYTQTPFFIAACDYVLIGDEFYAASAYLTRMPVLVGSLVGQDWGKLLLGGLVLFGALWNTVVIDSKVKITEAWSEGKMQPLKEPRLIAKPDTLVSRLLNPDPEKKPAIERPKLPKDELPAGGQK